MRLHIVHRHSARRTIPLQRRKPRPASPAHGLLSALHTDRRGDAAAHHYTRYCTDLSRRGTTASPLLVGEAHLPGLTFIACCDISVQSPTVWYADCFCNIHTADSKANSSWSWKPLLDGPSRRDRALEAAGDARTCMCHSWPASVPAGASCDSMAPRTAVKAPC